MDLSDFSSNKSWLIIPNSLESMTQWASKKFDSTEFSIFSQPNDFESVYEIRDGVAIIPIVGPLSKRSSFFSRFFGGRASMVDIGRMIDAAAIDPNVKAIVLDIDSPGGTVSGTEKLGNTIFAARNSKPVVSFANGMMASAAYWAGSGAHKVVVESTSDVGSIGVVTMHVEYSKLDENIGIKCTVMAAGKYKAIGNDAEPLSDLAKETIQSELDYIYSMFVDTVARNRSVTTEEALKMADGKIFIGQQAIDAGLADQIGTLEDAIALALEMAVPQKIKNKQEAKAMDLKELQEKHPELYNQIVDKAKAETEAVAAENVTLKAENEKLKGETVSLAEDNKSLGKRVVALEAKDAQRELEASVAGANAAMDSKLAGSKIPENMYARVKKCVQVESFFTDGKFDMAAFSTAVDAEIADWEKDISDNPVVIGSGFSSRAAAEENGGLDAEEDSLVNELLEMSK